MVTGFPVRSVMLLVLAATISLPSFGEDIHDKTQRKAGEVPTCEYKLGTMAIYEPQTNWWRELDLSSPKALLKVIVSRSGCFTLVDRGKGFSVAQQERALASSGTLRGGSNVGKGQVKAADYVLVPDVVSRNANSGGSGIGGILGGLIGGTAGAIVSRININSSTADVTLTITDVRSSEQVAMTEGHGEKSDLSFGAGGGLGVFGGGGAVGVSSYEHTTIGQVVTLAYIDAYAKLVDQMGGLSGDASADSAAQAVNVVRPGRMYTRPEGKGKTVRSLKPGMMLYPTGQKDGVWWEVQDEMGNKGWVSNLILELAK